MIQFKWKSPINDLYDILYASDWEDVKYFRRAGIGKKGLVEYRESHQKALKYIEEKTFEIIEKKRIEDNTKASLVFYMLIDSYNKNLPKENRQDMLRHRRCATWVEGYLLLLSQSNEPYIYSSDIEKILSK